MTTKVSRWKRIALLATGISASMVSALWGQTSLFQMHNDGTIWNYTGVPCNRGVCPGWRQIGSGASRIAGGGGSVYYEAYALYDPNTLVYGWNTLGCEQNCWIQLNTPPSFVSNDIVAYGSTAASVRSDGTLWGTYFQGECWPIACNLYELDSGDQAISHVYVGGYSGLDYEYSGGVFEIRAGGSIWASDGVACVPACTDWQQFDNNPLTTTLAVGNSALYEMWSSIAFH